MMKRVLNLAKSGHDYVFQYDSGNEGEILDEIMSIASDAKSDIDWIDAALLGFQVAQYAAADCCAALMPAVRIHAEIDSIEPRVGGDDSKDGSCNNGCP